MRAEDDEGSNFDRCIRVINQRAFQSAALNTRRGVDMRLRMMEEAKLAPMLLLRAKTIEDLGYIPRSDEARPFLIEARKAISDAAAGVFASKHQKGAAYIVFVSHMWLRGNWCKALGRDLPWGSPEREEAAALGHAIGDIDSADHEKAAALVEWAKWAVWSLTTRLDCSLEGRGLEDCLDISYWRELQSVSYDDMTADRPILKSNQDQQKAYAPEIFFWIDMACADQTNKETLVPFMEALPAFAAVSNMTLAYWTPHYIDRAWCRVEVLLSYAHSSNGSKLFLVQKGFKHTKTSGVTWESLALPDPREGKLSNSNDKPIVEQLTQEAESSRTFSCYQIWLRTSCPYQGDSGDGLAGNLVGVYFMNAATGCQCYGLYPLATSRSVIAGNSSLTMVHPNKPPNAPTNSGMVRV